MASGSPFRAAFGDAVWSRFVSAGERVRLDGGAVLMRRGDPAGQVFVLESGHLEAIDPRTSPPTVLGVFEAGAVMGELSFLDGSPVSVDVRARDCAAGIRFVRGALAAALAADPELDAAFHRGVARLLAGRTRTLTSAVVAESIGRRDADSADHSDLARRDPTDELDLPVDPGLDPHVAAALLARQRPVVRVAVTGDRVRIGSGEGNEVVLPDPRIAPVHAELIRGDTGWRVVSTARRAVVVDGSPVASAPVSVPSELRVGRYRLVFSGDAVEVHAPAVSFALHAEGLGRDIGGRAILSDVSFSVLAGEVVAVIGPSGAGKSSLLDALRGRADRGRVRIDGHDFPTLLRAVPTLLGEVPQDDLVLPELTVEENLRGAATLRVPGLSAPSRELVVNRVIDDLGLEPIRASRVGDPERRGISGGQRKRVNIAQELLSDSNRVLFLDEPTSGLDPRSAADIARLARRLADEGRVVLMVTHDVSPTVLDQVDHLLVLVSGGRLAWFGPVEAATAHFGAAQPAEIFDRLADRNSEGWASYFQGSESADRWVRKRLALAPDVFGAAVGAAAVPTPSVGAQLSVLLERNLKAKLRDRASMAVLFAQPVLVAGVMVAVFGHATAGLVYLLVLACFWFGMSASVRELIADQVIWRREHRLGLSPLLWVGAKAAVVGGAVAVQCLAVTGVAWAWALAGVGFAPLALAGVSVLTGLVGVATGLLTSALSRRSDAAVGAIVLLLVPQLAFSGILMPLDQIAPAARWISWFTPVRYAFHLALRAGERLSYLSTLGDWHERPVSGELFVLGLRPSGEGALGLSVGMLVSVLVAWLVVAGGAAVARFAARGHR